MKSGDRISQFFNFHFFSFFFFFSERQDAILAQQYQDHLRNDITATVGINGTGYVQDTGS